MNPVAKDGYVRSQRLADSHGPDTASMTREAPDLIAVGVYFSDCVVFASTVHIAGGVYCDSFYPVCMARKAPDLIAT